MHLRRSQRFLSQVDNGRVTASRLNLLIVSDYQPHHPTLNLPTLKWTRVHLLHLSLATPVNLHDRHWLVGGSQQLTYRIRLIGFDETTKFGNVSLTSDVQIEPVEGAKFLDVRARCLLPIGWHL